MAEEHTPWGSVVRISVYLPYPPQRFGQQQLTALAEAVKQGAPEATFVGMRIDPVAEEPVDQIAT